MTLVKTVPLLLALLTGILPSFAKGVEIPGTVTKVTGSKVKIVCDSEYVPSEGDSVRIGFELGGELIVVEGTWTIVEARPDFSWAAREEGGVGTASTGYVAVISSPDPKTKPEAAYLAGMKYRYGQGVEENLEEGLRWFLKAAGMGHKLAQAEAAKMFEHGEGVAQNYPEAVRLYSPAAEQGVTMAQLGLGFLKYFGRGTPKDEAGALALFRKAAAQGNTAAMNNIGGMYEFGTGGIAKDCKEAMNWYVRASEKGYARATKNIGRLYEQGCGVRKDMKKARELYRQAADNGHNYGLYQLAVSYWNEGGKKNKKKAVEYYQQAAAQGVQEARDWLKANGY